jgi:thiamine biosynthesis lipoprotein
MPFFKRLLKSHFITWSVLALTLTGSARAMDSSRARWLMGTLCQATAQGPDADVAISAVFTEIARIEAVLSTYRDNSEVSRLNQSGAAWHQASATLWEVLTLSSKFYHQTQGAFDPTYGSTDAARGFGKIEMDHKRHRVRLPKGSHLDFGAIGKGYALDRAYATLKMHRIHSALINFGGQIIVLGSPRDGSAWPVEAATPSCAGEPSTGRCRIWTATVKGGSVATTNLRERGKHVINPHSGTAVVHAGSITVFAPTASEADAWSTALFVDPTLTVPYCTLLLSPNSYRQLGNCRPYLIQEKNHDS